MELWPQLFLVKGDTINSAVDPILLLTSSKNSIIINSFHGGRGADSLVSSFHSYGESLRPSQESNC